MESQDVCVFTRNRQGDLRGEYKRLCEEWRYTLLHRRSAKSPRRRLSCVAWHSTCWSIDCMHESQPHLSITTLQPQPQQQSTPAYDVADCGHALKHFFSAIFCLSCVNRISSGESGQEQNWRRPFRETKCRKFSCRNAVKWNLRSCCIRNQFVLLWWNLKLLLCKL